MAPDTTRQAEPLTWKEAYGDLMHNVHRCIIGQIDVVALTHHQGRIMDSLAANPPADESATITSLQRELAEAREFIAELQRLREAVMEWRSDSSAKADGRLADVSISVEGQLQAMTKGPRPFPGDPPDSSGNWVYSQTCGCWKLLAPTTARPSLMDGFKTWWTANAMTDRNPPETVAAAAWKACASQSAPGPSDAKGEKLTPLTDPSVRGVLVACNTSDAGGSVVACPDGGHCWGKLRPASEFGVPAADELLRLRFAYSHAVEHVNEYCDKLKRAEAELTKLKSTPAEPAQKLVPLPEGVVEMVVRDTRSRSAGDVGLYWSHSKAWPDNGGGCFWADHGAGKPNWIPVKVVDPALYGVDAGRVECMACGRGMDRGGICGECKGDELQLAHYVKEAERLRKAIERALPTLLPIAIARGILEAALTPPTAASGETNQTGERSCCRNSAMTAVENSIAASNACLGYATNAGQKSPTTESPNPSAHAAECTATTANAVTTNSTITEPPSAPAAESEGGDDALDPEVAGALKLMENTLLCFDENDQPQFIKVEPIVASNHRRLLQTAFNRGKENRALSARLAACEERCRELERLEIACRSLVASKHRRNDCPDWVHVWPMHIDAIESLLAPKGEGGGDGD